MMGKSFVKTAYKKMNMAMNPASSDHSTHEGE
jgi:hypothetical protein